MAERPPPPLMPPSTAYFTQPPLRHSSEQMTSTFRRVLSTKRMNDLSRSAYPVTYRAKHESSDLGNAPPSYNSLRNLPLVPATPVDPRSIRFRNLLHQLSKMPVNWENPGLLDEALRSVPLESIYAEAEEESQIYQAEAESLGAGNRPSLGYQDCLVKALMKWFHGRFFSWVNNPYCARCGSPTHAMGMAARNDEENLRGATTVEVYRCSHSECGAFERFPRYNDAFVLMSTRRGRVGEWTNCFGMLCRAMGIRVRWIWNSEDHVWIEVYSVHQKRWIHVDACEGRFDQPFLYTEGWGRRLGYCIAFSRDGATDVTRRYVRNFQKNGGPRTRCPEPVLVHIIDEIRRERRKDLHKPEKFRLKGEDIREDKELSLQIAENLAIELCQSLPGAVRSRPSGFEAVGNTTARSSNGASGSPNSYQRPGD